MAKKLPNEPENLDAMAKQIAFDVWLKKGIRSLHDVAANEPLSDRLIALLKTLDVDEAE